MRLLQINHDYNLSDTVVSDSLWAPYFGGFWGGISGGLPGFGNIGYWSDGKLVLWIGRIFFKYDRQRKDISENISSLSDNQYHFKRDLDTEIWNLWCGCCDEFQSHLFEYIKFDVYEIQIWVCNSLCGEVK